jgi:hypothetical protein
MHSHRHGCCHKQATCCHLKAWVCRDTPYHHRAAPRPPANPYAKATLLAQTVGHDTQGGAWALQSSCCWRCLDVVAPHPQALDRRGSQLGCCPRKSRAAAVTLPLVCQEALASSRCDGVAEQVTVTIQTMLPQAQEQYTRSKRTHSLADTATQPHTPPKHSTRCTAHRFRCSSESRFLLVIRTQSAGRTRPSEPGSCNTQQGWVATQHSEIHHGLLQWRERDPPVCETPTPVAACAGALQHTWRAHFCRPRHTHWCC